MLTLQVEAHHNSIVYHNWLGPNDMANISFCQGSGPNKCHVDNARVTQNNMFDIFNTRTKSTLRWEKSFINEMQSRVLLDVTCIELSNFLSLGKIHKR